MSFSGLDKSFMQEALRLASYAEAEGEIPIGAVVVVNNQIVASAYNQNIKLNDPTAHAEILALREAGQQLGNYRLNSAQLFVTIEPCMMCAGAMIHSRIQRLVYGASESKAGVAHSNLCAFHQDFINHQIKVEGGLLAEQCGQLMSSFFKKRRAEKALDTQS